MKKVMVFLIGAGPGDPELISVRGLSCLRSADVVLYDHLVHPRLLRFARPEAEQIDVGVASPEPMAQEAICYLLAEKAREGKVVARLKWGDPFVFDHGGQEALFLHEQGVRFEVVPGIPAAIGVPSYSGIPVTYPGGGDTLTFVRGHEDEGSEAPAVDWTSLAKLEGTVVCYTGSRQLLAIVESLLSHGRSADESAALIYNGTLPNQETIQTTLGEIRELARKGARRQPAIFVVGRVAGLREHLRWFDERPLFGKRIVVTRPREQAAEFVDLLEHLGAEAIEAPLVRILPLEDFGAMDEACRSIRSFNWIILTSVNAADSFMRRLLAGTGDVRDLNGVKLCAIGHATAAELARYGLKVDLIPTDYRQEGLVQALAGTGDLRGVRCLWPRADQAREVLAEELRRAGAEVTEVPAYRTELAELAREGEPDIYGMLLERRIDVVTFTSPSAVKSFVRVYGEEPAADLLRTTIVASIGPVTAEAAERFNIHTTIVPTQYTIPALVDAIVEYFTSHVES